MKHHLNTLFVTTPRAYLKKDGQAVAVSIGKEIRLRVPLHNLGGIVAFGSIGASPALMAACAKAGLAISFVTEHGGFLARVSGFTPGNVLLRREQYRRADHDGETLAIARMVVTGKVANVRAILLRAMRDYPESPRRSDIDRVAARLAATLDDITQVSTLDSLRGLEGDSAKSYFGVFNGLITA